VQLLKKFGGKVVLSTPLFGTVDRAEARLT
jgi:hypothetical protein